MVVPQWLLRKVFSIYRNLRIGIGHLIYTHPRNHNWSFGQEGHLTTKNLFQHSHGWTTAWQVTIRTKHDFLEHGRVTMIDRDILKWKCTEGWLQPLYLAALVPNLRPWNQGWRLRSADSDQLLSVIYFVSFALLYTVYSFWNILKIYRIYQLKNFLLK